ncbi:GNAT family N-acetyltransferase [Pseudomonas veronii]|uniref:bifunctional helix-turn-helix transcriptional regulator/GNAT family N-acetyltransferase n=1 Tax=Pseudomonas TaxID=286 RepID=UPI0009A54ADD|nr:MULTISPECIES: bifunctional helix-turn-helix transcriptional regulator/GNAT family N-acetyltransferase [Pseudomonas]AQY66687.1 MarR family transcriptional regulator [Pseudomonas veronii]MDY7552963.1 bifunctional helix-turn-helix transcriptional regulator/GNAT family N-acetyltransferase [Pseudomonas sp. FG1]MEB0053640.1 bifunctional helix-turn-helix transcriptional regulator/GNAT family N-acetyltransferase [Pseudomonas sp. FG1]RTY67988.1 GNAT family N-acetyltransferase [Pseudomonas veronii]UH
MSTPLLVQRAGIVRGFNRFYTHQIGVLQEHLLQSDFSLTEIRVMYELSSRGDLTSADLCQMLSLDAGYLSRLISGLEKKGLIQKVRSITDARAVQLHLSDLGRSVLAPLEEKTQQEVMALLSALPEPQQQQLTAAMQRIQTLLQGSAPSYVLRDPQPGDMGLVVQQQSALYAREYQWNWEFEALVAEIVAKYLREFDPTRERCWIAEKDGAVVGSVFVVRHDDSTAKLRMLYVDASARGLGIGQRLVDECLRFARHAGYTRMMLWTMSALTDARRLYQKAGFELVEEEPTLSFGKPLVSQTWARAL